MAKSYLDKDGLTYLWGKIKDYIDNHSGGGAQINKIYTATCPTAAGTATKVATLEDSTGFSLATGVRVAVRFQYGNTAATPALNVNSSGAKNIAYPTSATAVATGSGAKFNRWGPYETVTFTYNGTNWVREATSLTSYLAYNIADTASSAASEAYTYADDNYTLISTMFKIVSYTYSYSNIASAGSLNVSATNLGMSTPTGYTPVACCQVSSGNGNVIARTWDVTVTGSTTAVALRNVATTAQSGTVTFKVLYALSDAITT